MAVSAELRPTGHRILRHPVLSHAEVVCLARTMHAGLAAATEISTCAEAAKNAQLRRAAEHGRDAKRRIMEHNLRLVASIARTYSVDGLTFDDHFQNGCIGLVRAVEKFDPDAGFRFSTYATWWIRQAIERGIANTSRLIRLPVHLLDTLRTIERARQALLAESGRAPISHLSAATGLTEARVRDLVQLLLGPLSLDAVVGDGLTTLGDFVPAAAGGEDDALDAREVLRPHLASLPEREREVIRLRFGMDGSEARTLEEVGRVYGVTRERIRQIEAKAMKKLRAALRGDPELSSQFGTSNENEYAEGHRAEGTVGPATRATDNTTTPSALASPATKARDDVIESVSRVRMSVTPRLRRMLEELARERGLDRQVLLATMGLPPTAPLEAMVRDANEALTAAGLPELVDTENRLCLAASVLEAWLMDV